MIGEYYSKKYNLNIGDLILYKNNLYLLLDLFIKNDRMLFVKLESISNKSKLEIPALYINNNYDKYS